MRISLDALLVLDSISRNGSFAAAGEELHRVPSRRCCGKDAICCGPRPTSNAA
ncbi:MAG: hypothetical protein ABI619_04285 [Betaproteobacteria bacterium]